MRLRETRSDQVQSPRQVLPSDDVVGPNHVATLIASAAPAPTPRAFGDRYRSGVSGNRGSFEPFYSAIVSGTLASVIACSHYLRVRASNGKRDSAGKPYPVAWGEGFTSSPLKGNHHAKRSQFRDPILFLLLFSNSCFAWLWRERTKGVPPGLLPLFFRFVARVFEGVCRVASPFLPVVACESGLLGLPGVPLRVLGGKDELSEGLQGLARRQGLRVARGRSDRCEGQARHSSRTNSEEEGSSIFFFSRQSLFLVLKLVKFYFIF